MTRLSVEFGWREVGELALDEAGRLRFPVAPRAPGLYRFWVGSARERPGIYIGEASDIRRRLQHYRTPGSGQLTNRRMNASLSEQLRRGAIVTVSVLIAAHVRLDSGHWGELDLSRKNQRLVVEQAAIASALLVEDSAAHGVATDPVRPRLLNRPGVGEDAYD